MAESISAPISRVRPDWGLRALGIERLWRRGFDGRGVEIGHLDTGLAGAHPALAGRVGAFRELGPGGETVAGPGAVDTGSHGSHTAGILCGGAACGLAIGVAPGARLCSAVVIDGGQNVLRILRGMEWLRRRALESGRLRVLSLTLGLPDPNPVFWTMLEALRAAGVLPVCPIGNHGYGFTHAPASHPHVLAVGAVDADGRPARFSGSDDDGEGGAVTKPELMAPGVGVLSASPHADLAIRRDGTSQASALVAGVAALLFQAVPEATPAAVERALCGSAEPIDGDEPRSRCGLVRPRRALELLRANPAASEPDPGAPPFYRDPRLENACRQQPGSLASTIVVAPRRPGGEPRGAAGAAVDRAAAAAGEPPTSVDYLPAARVAVVRARPRLTRALLDDPEIPVLSDATARNPCALFPFW